MSMKLLLKSDKFHIWQQPLTVPPALINTFSSFLSSDEKQKADRFRRPVSRQQYIVSRGGLRLVLSRYLAIEPQNIHFDYGPFGKPFLADTSQVPLNFNVSHSGKLALFAIAPHGRVGVDIEYVNTDLDFMSLSQRYFSPREHQLLKTCSAEQKRTVFFQIWTCKEALLKAQGMGIRDLETVEILTPSEEPLQSVQFISARSSSVFSLQLLPTYPEYVAALSIEGAFLT